MSRNGRQKRVLQENPFLVPFSRDDKNPKRPRVVFRDLTPEQLKRRVEFICCLITPPKLNGFASSSLKMKSGSRTINLSTTSNGVMSIKILSLLRRDGKKQILCFFFCWEGPVYWRRWNYRLYSLLQATRGDRGRQAHTVPDGQRQTASSENHPTKPKGPRDGVAVSFTLFPECGAVRISCISKPGKRMSQMVLKESQRRVVCIADLDRDHTSRLLEERTRTTARTMEDNRENTREVLQRSQEFLNRRYLP